MREGLTGSRDVLLCWVLWHICTLFIGEGVVKDFHKEKFSGRSFCVFVNC